MNMAMTEPELSTAKPLKDRVSLVTGSTSGIGLGIARALAAAGSAVILNGFGKIEEIKATQASITLEFGVPVTYSAADMSNPASIEEMIKMAFDMFGSLDILQRRHPVCSPIARVSRSQVGCRHRHQFELGVPYDAARAPLHDRQKMGPHHQHRISSWAGGLGLQVGLCGGKTWYAWAH